MKKEVVFKFEITLSPASEGRLAVSVNGGTFPDMDSELWESLSPVELGFVRQTLTSAVGRWLTSFYKDIREAKKAQKAGK